MNKEIEYKTNWLGEELSVKTGKLAKQADSAVLVQYGETVVLVTVVESQTEREGVDFFPLMVDVEEKLYAAGIIKGSKWVKREGRPSDDSVLTGRMVDRSIRPLFDQTGKKDVQVLISILAVDKKNDHDVIALTAASIALSLTDITWNGPICGIRVGRIAGEFIFNPTYEERLQSDLDLIIASTKSKVIMIEAGANEINEADMNKAIQAGHKQTVEIIKFIEKIKNEIGTKLTKNVKIKKIEVSEEKLRIKEESNTWLDKNIEKILFDKTYYTKNERKAAVKEIKLQLDLFLEGKEWAADLRKWIVKDLVEIKVEGAVTEGVLKNKKRVDGRKLNEIRSLGAEISLLPMVHGSSLFERGETQVMSIVTLGAPGMKQTLEGVEGMEDKRFMHHYNFPPFSVGEAKPLRTAGRREIGHGALAEKALIPVLPSIEDFPYTIRIVSETLGSNGSSSMASTCASTLALMDAGVPIKKKVAGIAIGLASNESMSEWEILTDIQDLEDGKGGMDFKVTGTEDGITAIQLDTKTDGLTFEMIEKALAYGKEAISNILKVMDEAIAEPRLEISQYAPKIIGFNINPQKIGNVIGAGGKIINKIIAEFDVQIDIEDDGHVMVSGVNIENAQKAVEYIKSLVKEYVPGEKVTGKVVRVEAFGAFLQITAQTDGLIHVSELAPYRVESVADFVKIGDELTAMVREVNDKGQVSLTLKGVEENAKLWVDGKGKSSGDGGGGDRRSASRDGGYNHGGGGGRFQDRGPRRDSGYKSRT